MLEQDPPAGEQADKGSTITLSVSTGPGTVEIPDVQGLSTKDAKKKLEDAGLRGRPRAQEFSDDVAEGLVFGTDPALGTGEPGSTVTMLISKGSNTVVVPGWSASARSSRLEIQQAGLTAIPQQRQDPSPAGKVLAQSPTPGQQVKKGAAITIFVSTGSLQVPNVVGQTKQAAVNALKHAGFKPVVSQDPSAPPESAGLVVSQFPARGQLRHARLDRADFRRRPADDDDTTPTRIGWPL